MGGPAHFRERVELGGACSLPEPVPGGAANADIAGEMAIQVAKAHRSHESADVRDDGSRTRERRVVRLNRHHQENRGA
jgi:hypothetical protein